MPFNSATLPDLFEAVGAARARSPKYILNDAMSHKYIAARFLMADKRKTLQGGQFIRHDIMLDHPRTFKMRDVDEVAQPQSSNLLTQWQLQWRKGYDMYTIREEEEILAPSGGNPTADEGAFLEFIDFEKKVIQGVMTSIWEGIEDKLFATPDTTKMESQSGLEPMSLWTYINDQPNGLPGNTNSVITVAGAFPGGAWSTKEGINPTSAGKYKWRPFLVGYTHNLNYLATGTVPSANAAGVLHQRTCVEALDDAIEQAAFEGPKGQGVDEYFLDTPPGASQDRATRFILTSLRGKSDIRFFYRNKQDAFIKQTDPWASEVQFAGYDIIRAPRMETSAVYNKANNDGTLVTEGQGLQFSGGNSGGVGPRFMVVNANHVFMAVHRQRYLYRYPVQVHPYQPWNHSVYYGIYFNLACESQQRQVMVVPGVISGTYGTATGQIYTPWSVTEAYV